MQMALFSDSTGHLEWPDRRGSVGARSAEPAPGECAPQIPAEPLEDADSSDYHLWLHSAARDFSPEAVTFLLALL